MVASGGRKGGSLGVSPDKNVGTSFVGRGYYASNPKPKG